MMEALSPVSRRIIAIGLLVLAIITTLNLIIIPLWQFNQAQLDDLAAARDRLSHMRAAIAIELPKPDAPLPADAVIVSPTRDTGIATMLGALSASGAKAGLSPTTLGLAPHSASADDRHLAVDIAASGSEMAIVSFVSDVEASTPAIRLQSWTILAPDVPGGPSKLQARAVAIWGTRP